MKVVIRFMGNLGHDLTGLDDSGEKILDLPKGSRVTDIFKRLKIPGNTEPVAMINNRISKPADVLTDGLVVTLLHAAYGG